MNFKLKSFSTPSAFDPSSNFERFSTQEPVVLSIKQIDNSDTFPVIVGPSQLVTITTIPTMSTIDTNMPNIDGVITIPVTGNYLINYSFYFDRVNSEYDITFGITINDTNFFIIQSFIPNIPNEYNIKSDSVSQTTVWPLSEGDTIKILVASAGTVNVKNLLLSAVKV